MTASAGSHSYNALSVWIGSQCRAEIVRILPPSVFWPRPKVDSAIVRLDVEPARRAAIGDLGRFHDFVRDVFCHRRKLLRGVLVRMAGGKQNLEAKATVERVWTAMGLKPSAGPRKFRQRTLSVWSVYFTRNVADDKPMEQTGGAT